MTAENIFREKKEPLSCLLDQDLPHLSFRSISSHLLTSATNWRWKAETSGFRSTNCAKPAQGVNSKFEPNCGQIECQLYQSENSKVENWYSLGQLSIPQAQQKPHLVPRALPHSYRPPQGEGRPGKEMVKCLKASPRVKPGSETSPRTWRGFPSRPRRSAANHSKKRKLNNSLENHARQVVKLTSGKKPLTFPSPWCLVSAVAVWALHVSVSAGTGTAATQVENLHKCASDSASNWSSRNLTFGLMSFINSIHDTRMSGYLQSKYVVLILTWLETSDLRADTGK